ncbi:uncharacterized protein LOC124957780 [Vespa velutina]|uniref:uncharacterized protein LOC124957780 n=1 Tax=Vespa velutina TaxID=202808 RepID=UPI001FB4DA27|nr:uncharacterized protein LOC124957780 [Vespa velutina]
MSPMQTQANNCGSLPQNIIDQIRSCIPNTAPIFIIPGGCQQPLVTTTQQATPTPDILNPLTSSNKQSNYIPSPISPIYPPFFYPYPIPFPLFDPYGTRSNEQQKNCGCSSKGNGEITGPKQFPALLYPHSSYYEEEHRCTNTTDDTICSKRNCPSAISLQALASQLLSIQGIISCTATRLLLRKIPGSNITTTMEDTMERAQRSISALNKDQLLGESRNSQQVNALINLHMTANPPANIIPILTLVQLKVNVLKAQVENLINTKLMETQGLEIEATDSIDPTILALKTDAELREFLVILKQKECDERVNLNFAPYRSQRVIAESRLSNVQKKIQQIEVEFERRRCNVAPSIPLSSRIVREFTETPGNFSSHSGYPDLTTSKRKTIESRESPDPFAITFKSPRKLRLKPHVGSPETTYDYSNKKKDQVKTTCDDKGSQIESKTKEKKRTDRTNLKNCNCYDESSSDESSEEDKKKKLQLQIDKRGNVTVTSEAKLKNVSFMKLASNVSLRTVKPSDVFEKRDRKVKPTRTEIDSNDIREPSLPTVPKVEEISEVTETDEPSVSADVDLVPDVKPYDTVGEKKRESIESAELTLDEFKDDADKDEREETKVSISDVNITDEEKIKKIVNLSHFKELTPSNDKEVQIPESKLDKTSASIEEGVIEVDKIKTNALTEESRKIISTNDFEEKLYTVKEEKIDDIPKSKTTKTERMMEVDSPKKTFVTTTSIKIEPTKIDEEYIDEPTAENSKVVDELSVKPKKTFLTTLKIGNSVKPEIKDETKRTIEVESPKKTFISTASIKIEPPKIDEEYIDESIAESSKISDEFPEKPKKTFLTTLKIGNSIKPEIKDGTKRTIEVEIPKKTFISTASIKIEPPKIDEEYTDESIAGSSKISDELSEKPKKTFLTTLKIGNSVKPEIKNEKEKTIEVGRPKKTFISTASIKIEPPKIDEEYIDEPMAESSKISDELSEKPKKTFLTTLKIGNSVKPEIKNEKEKTIEVESPKKTFISTASIKIEPPKIDEEYTDESIAGSSKISDELSEEPKKTFLTTLKIDNSVKPEIKNEKEKTIEVGRPKKTFISTASIKIEPPKIDEEYIDEPMAESFKISDELSEKPKKTFLATLKIGNSVKPEIKNKKEKTIEVESPKKTFISTASIKIEPPKIDEEYIDESIAGSSKISDELSEEPKKTFLTTLKIGNSIKPEIKDENEKTIENRDSKKTFVTKAFIKVEPEDHEEKQLKTKLFKINPMEMRINLNNKEGYENHERENAKVQSGKSSGSLYKSTVNFVLKGTDENDLKKSVGTNTIATISIGKKEDEVKEKEKSDVGTNEKIVSVLTEIKYDEPEAIAKLFRSALTRNFQLDNDIVDRSCESKYESSETGNYYTMALSFPENRFPWRIDIKKHENGIKHLNNQSRDAENTFHPEETWSKLNTCKYNTETTRFPFVNCNRDTSNITIQNNRGILSEIISLMSNQISYFGSAINKIPLFGNIPLSFDGSVPDKINLTSSNYYSKSKSKNFEKIWIDPCKEYLAIFEDVRKLDDDEIENLDCFVASNSKRSIKKLDKKVRRVIRNGSSRIPRKDDNKEIRDRLRYMIIKDKDNKKSYLMPEDSFRGHNSQPYPRPNLARPYKIRRNLLIRSRLKECNAFKQNLPPFTIVKRTHVGNRKSFCDTTEEEKRRRTFSREKNVKKDENFFSLPLIKEKNSKISSTLEKSSTSKAIPNESDTKTTVTFFSNDS